MAKNSKIITKSDGVCDGRAHIAGTDLPVWKLIMMAQVGLSFTDLLDLFPNVPRESIKAALFYFSENQDEIDQDIYECDPESPAVSQGD